MLHQAMHVEATTWAEGSAVATQFTCSIVEDFTDKGEIKSCCWDGGMEGALDSLCVPSDGSALRWLGQLVEVQGKQGHGEAAE